MPGRALLFMAGLCLCCGMEWLAGVYLLFAALASWKNG